MNGKPLIEKDDPALITRAYNLGLKLVPNLAHILTVEDLEYWEANVSRLKEGLEWSFAKYRLPTGYLRLLYNGQEIIIGPTKGKRTIAQANAVFVSYNGPDFKNKGLVVPDQLTNTVVTVRELIAGGTFADVFESAGRPLEELCLTQDQIVEFCVRHKEKLGPLNSCTFFLLQEEGKFFVANTVVQKYGRLRAVAREFSDNHVWKAETPRHCFVLPEPIAASTSA